MVRELGRGGMGVVYEVRDPALPQRRLALKLILALDDPEALARFEREVELLARVRHRNVVPVHAVARAPEGPYLIMDLIEGEALSTRAARGLTPREATTIVRDLCDAVAALHAVGIVHRDLKPQNVIVRQDGSPVLLDFGVARAATGASLTRTGEILGSPRYMSPEQAQGKGVAPIDERSDVYGLGAILFELLAGAPPFAEVEGTPFNVMFAVLEREPTWPSGRAVPPALKAICRRAMAKVPAERFQTAADLRAALVVVPLDAPGGTTPRVAVLAAVAVLAIVVAAVLALSPRGPQAVDGPAPVATSVPTKSVPTSEPPSPTTSEAPPRAQAAFERRATLMHPPSTDRLQSTRALWLDPERVVTCGGQELHVWDVSGERKELVSTVVLDIWMKLLALVGDRVLVAGDGVQLFARADLRPLGPVVFHELPDCEVDALSVAKDGQTVALAFNHGPPLRVRRTADLTEVCTPESRPTLRALAYSPLGDRLVGAPRGGENRVLTSWRVDPEGIVGEAADHELFGAANALAFSPDGRDLVVGTTKGMVMLYDVDMKPQMLTAEDGPTAFALGAEVVHAPTVIDVAFSCDGLLFTLVGDETTSTLRVWSRGSWTPLTEPTPLGHRAHHLAPSPDGRRLLVCFLGRVEVWDVPESLRASGR